MTDYEDFFQAVEEIEQVQERLIKLKTKLQERMSQIPVGTMFQDPVTNTVYKIVKPKGKFVYFEDVDYVRTAKELETKGTLSKKEAETAGFKV